MKKTALRKEFWMSIRKSPGRFLSIFLIVALGVSFFAGIRSSEPDMRISGDRYYDETNLMDLKVQGTLGLTDDDVEALSKVEGIQSEEGAYSVDVLCKVGENEKCSTSHQPVIRSIRRQYQREGCQKEHPNACWMKTS